MKLKRICSLVLAICLLVSVVPVAHAADGVQLIRAPQKLLTAGESYAMTLGGSGSELLQWSNQDSYGKMFKVTVPAGKWYQFSIATEQVADVLATEQVGDVLIRFSTSMEQTEFMRQMAGNLVDKADTSKYREEWVFLPGGYTYYLYAGGVGGQTTMVKGVKATVSVKEVKVLPGASNLGKEFDLVYGGTQGDLATDNYHWDQAAKTLTLAGSSNATFLLPGGSTVVPQGSVAVHAIEVEGTGTLTVKGGTLKVQYLHVSQLVLDRATVDADLDWRWVGSTGPALTLRNGAKGSFVAIRPESISKKRADVTVSDTSILSAYGQMLLGDLTMDNTATLHASVAYAPDRIASQGDAVALAFNGKNGIPERSIKEKDFLVPFGNEQVLCSDETGSRKFAAVADFYPCAGGHDEKFMSDWVSNGDATVEADGTESRACGICGAVETRTDKGSKLPDPCEKGHAWGAPVWTWTGFNASAKFTCKTDASHTQTVTAAVTNKVTTAAACEKAGVRTYTATVTLDGETYTAAKTEAVSALGHTWGEPVWTWTGFNASAKFTCKTDAAHTRTVTAAVTSKITTEPACENTGVRTYTAAVSFNGKTYTTAKTETLSASGHSFGNWETTKAATCVDKGVESRNCPNCGKTETRETNALDHSYKDTVTQPTCTEKGYTTHICTRCGNSYQDTEVPAAGHKWGEWTVTVSPTETSKGSETRKCAACGATETREISELPHKHGYTEVKTAATCTEGGYSTFTCACGESYVGAITPPLGHNYAAVVTKPTCTEGGHTTYTCSRCGNSYKDAYTEALGHSFGGWKVTKVATCTDKGTETRTCSKCGSVETRATAALGHKTVLKNAKAATCTANGYTGDKVCSTCGKVVEAGKTIAASGHSFGSWVSNQDATTEKDGTKTHTCSRCGKKETVTDAGSKLPKPTEPSKPCDGGSKCPSRQFRDVKKTDWFHLPVDFMVERGMMNGTSGTAFSPNSTLTRAMLVTVLYRYEGSPATSGKAPFRDVPSGEYYYRAVCWAAKEGIVNGTSATTFSPNAKITREQMVAILYRYAQYKGIDVSGQASLKGFPDSGRISSYARAAFAWSVGADVIHGSGGRLVPQGTATRAEVATMLMNFITAIVEKL